MNDNIVSVIDGRTDEAIRNVTIGRFPDSIAVDPNNNKVYVSSRDDNSISVINSATDKVVGTIPFGDKIVSGISVDPNNNGEELLSLFQFLSNVNTRINNNESKIPLP